MRERRAAARAAPTEEVGVDNTDPNTDTEEVGVDNTDPKQSAEKDETVCDEEVTTEHLEKNEIEEVSTDIPTIAVKATETFSCDLCDLTFQSMKSLRMHKSKKHKNSTKSPIPQLDGLECDSEHSITLKAVIVEKDQASAEAELREFYIGEMIPKYSGDITLIESESGEVFDCQDSGYSGWNYRKYTYIFKISDNYSWEEIKSIMYTDKVRELNIIRYLYLELDSTVNAVKVTLTCF